MALDRADVWNQLVLGLHDVLGCSGIAILIPQGLRAQVIAQHGHQPLPPWIDLSASERHMLDQLTRARPALRRLLNSSERAPLPAPARGPEWIGAPISGDGRVFGLLSMVGEFQAGDERVAAELARQAATTLGWAERALAAERAAEQAQRLIEIERRMRQTGDQIAALDLVLAESMDFTGATHGCILISRGGHTTPIARRGYSQEEAALLEQIPPSLERGLVGQALRTRAVARADDVSADPSAPPFLMGTRSQMVVPIYSGDQAIGLLDLQSPRPGAFRGADQAWLLALAGLATRPLGQRARLGTQPTLAEPALQHDVALSSRLAIVNDLAAGVAHEINNPLTTILGYAHLLLRDQALPPAMRDDIEQIMVEGQRIAALVERFLRFAQPTSNGKRPLAIDEPLAEALALLKNRLRESHIQVDVERPPESPMILGQLGQLEQAFVDLLENAIEAIGSHDQRRISIRVGEQAGWARVAISDTGRGIRPDLLTRVFEPGFTTKVDKGISRGLGLGLYATHTIIQEHWGRIEVQSQIWQGSTFTVCLPTI